MIFALIHLLLATVGLAAIVAPVAVLGMRELTPARVPYRAVFAGGGWR